MGLAGADRDPRGGGNLARVVSLAKAWAAEGRSSGFLFKHSEMRVLSSAGPSSGTLP